MKEPMPNVPRVACRSWAEWVCFNRLDLTPKWEQLWVNSEPILDPTRLPRNTAILITSQHRHLFWGVTCSSTRKGRARALVGDTYMELSDAQVRLPLWPAGTRIQFKKTLTEPANEDHPGRIYCEAGGTGWITGHGTREGYWAKWDRWPSAAFGIARAEFDVHFSDHK